MKRIHKAALQLPRCPGHSMARYVFDVNDVKDPVQERDICRVCGNTGFHLEKMSLATYDPVEAVCRMLERSN